MAAEVRPVTAAEERWREHVAAWAASGLSCKGHAAKARVNSRTLTWWKSKLGQAATPATFVEVTSQVAVSADAEAGVLELVVGRALLRVRGRVDAAALAQVLDVLEARA